MSVKYGKSPPSLGISHHVQPLGRCTEGTGVDGFMIEWGYQCLATVALFSTKTKLHDGA